MSPFCIPAPKPTATADANATSGQIKMSLKMSNNYLKAVAMKQKLNTGRRSCVNKRFTWIVKVRNMYTCACVCVCLIEKYPPKRALTVALIAYIWQWEWKLTFLWVFFFILLHKWFFFFKHPWAKRGGTYISVKCLEEESQRNATHFTDLGSVKDYRGWTTSGHIWVSKWEWSP